MTKELIVNEKRIDLTDAKVALTFQANDLTKPETIQGNYSNQFLIPSNEHNRRELEGLVELQSETNLPYEKVTAKYIQNGNEVFGNGYGVIDGVEGEKIKVTLYSGFADFFRAIEGKSIRDIRFKKINNNQYLQDLAHWAFFSFSGIDNGLGQDLTDPYDYPATMFWYNYGDLNSETVFDIREQFPSVRVKSLLMKLSKDAEFVPVGNFYGTEFLNNLYIPFSLLEVRPNSDYLNNERFLAIKNNNQALTGATNWEPIIFEDDFNLGSDIGGHYDPLTGRYYAGSIGIKARFKVTLNAGFVLQTGNIEAYINIGDYSGGFPFPNNIGSLLMNGDGEYVFEKEVIIPPGDYINAVVWCERGGSGQIFAADIFQGSKFETTLTGLLTDYGISDNLPDVSQKDFVKDLIYLSNTIPVIDKYTKEIDFKPFDFLYENKSIARDWTYKLADPKKASKSFRIPGLARKNNLKWKKNEVDGIAEDYGNSALTINDENLEAEKNYYQMHFCASPEETKFNELKTVKIKRVDGSNRKDAGARMVYADLKKVFKTITLTDGTNTGSFSTFRHNSTFIPLKFENIKERNYKNFQESLLNQSKMVVEYFKLNGKDVEDFDFLIPIYLQQHNNYFYVNKIENYTGEGLTRVELIRL